MRERITVDPIPRDWDEVLDRLSRGDRRSSSCKKIIEKNKGEGTLHLDIGTGQGQFLDKLSTIKNIKLCGLDYGFSSTSICKKKGHTMIQADARFLPFKKEISDSVSPLDVIEHIPSYHLVIREVNRALKRNGLLIITTPNKSSVLIKIKIFLIRIKVLKQKQPYDEPIYLDNLIEEIRRNRFSIDKIRKFDFIYFLILCRKINNHKI